LPSDKSNDFVKSKEVKIIRRKRYQKVINESSGVIAKMRYLELLFRKIPSACFEKEERYLLPQNAENRD